jgi:hypothetical protein
VLRPPRARSVCACTSLRLACTVTFQRTSRQGAQTQRSRCSPRHLSSFGCAASMGAFGPCSAEMSLPQSYCDRFVMRDAARPGHGAPMLLQAGTVHRYTTRADWARLHARMTAFDPCVWPQWVEAGGRGGGQPQERTDAFPPDAAVGHDPNFWYSVLAGHASPITPGPVDPSRSLAAGAIQTPRRPATAISRIPYHARGYDPRSHRPDDTLQSVSYERDTVCRFTLRRACV